MGCVIYGVGLFMFDLFVHYVVFNIIVWASIPFIYSIFAVFCATPLP